ncbi:neuronal acetylcholine receptor subunit alpha-6-like [Haliotis rufescens]|uniref:neuronal acetylcholine receptor subunit alpha-6-like n=1 Tax=Haliotis rufescens TaxID=6454 RepID=UPI00201FABCE|nr:neuronal acetylcholine receptor subunit alpha-6-like [Haliotis rufescens]
MFDFCRCFFILLLCHLTIGSVSYKEKDFLANLTLKYDPKIRPVLDGSKSTVEDTSLDLETYKENGEFHLFSSSIELQEFKVYNNSQEWIKVTLVLQRRPMFYILNNILPVVFLSFLNTFASLLPEESGEKMSLCVSILLSYAVFLTLINSYLPANSDHLCFFSVYVTLLVLISTLTCLVTIFILVFHSHLQRDMDSPRWLPIAWGSDSKVGTTEPRVKNDDVAPYQSDVKDKANKKLDMKDATITKCNKVAFGTFFTLTILVNLIFFISVSL